MHCSILVFSELDAFENCELSTNTPEDGTISAETYVGTRKY
jgi:hypothetical protein